MTPVADRVNDCWNHIGIGGDRSCPELAQHVVCHNCPVFAAGARTLFDRPAPAGYLAEWAESLTQAEHAAAAEGVTALLFRLGGERLALASAFLLEVTTSRPVHAVPHKTNEVFRGLVNLRGQLQLCVSLHALLGVRPAAGEPQRADTAKLVVAGKPNDRWAFAADEVLGVERVAAEELRKVPGTLANPGSGYTQAVFSWREHNVGLLDGERLLAALRGLVA